MLLYSRYSKSLNWILRFDIDIYRNHVCNEERKRWQRSTDECCACHSVTPKDPTKGREITPDRQIYLIQRRVEVACGVARRCKCWEVGLGMAATCWVRQYRVFTNATLPSQPEDSRGWLLFFPVRGSNETNVSLLSSDLLNRFYARRSLHFYRLSERM